MGHAVAWNIQRMAHSTPASRSGGWAPVSLVPGKFESKLKGLIFQKVSSFSFPQAPPQQPFPLPRSLFHPRPPSYCCRLPLLVAVPGFIIPSYPTSPGNDILLALTSAPPPPANQAVYTPVGQFAYCCSCPLISPSTSVFMLNGLGVPCTKNFLFASWEAHSV